MATPVLWKDVVGFEGLYIVSNFGEIRSVDHYVRCNSGKRLVKGRTLKPCNTPCNTAKCPTQHRANNISFRPFFTCFNPFLNNF